MTEVDWNSSGYNAYKSFILGLLAKFAYERPPRLSEKLKNLNMSLLKFFESKEVGLRAFIAANNETLILSFNAGVADPSATTDSSTRLVTTPTGKVHDGFSSALDVLWPDLLRTIQASQGSRALWITGHSLGGTAAVKFAAKLLEKGEFPITGLTTFGQPRIGDAEFAKAIENKYQLSYFRYINEGDIVTQVPIRTTRHQHAGTLLLFDESGNLESDPRVVQTHADKNPNISSILNSQKQIAAHSMYLYLKNLRMAVEQGMGFQPIEVGKRFSVNTDQADGEDKLNYARFADAFATLVQNPDAKTPITIGIYGQWGSGKSFLMKKIIQVLRKDQSNAPKTWSEKMIKPVGQLFSPKKDKQVETIIIEFNAWVYSGSEHLWASLVTHLYREIERYFGVRAHYHRLIKAFKRFIPKSIGVFLFYAIPGLLISLLVGVDNIQKAWEAANIALKAVSVSVVGGSLLATIPVLWSALREFADTLFLSRAMNLQILAAKPDFRDQLGVMADIKSEIGFISHLLETQNKRQQTRIVLFIDDLDRCEHRKAVEVLQAIMLLLADRDGSPFVIFLGIDARVIVRAIEEHYGDVLVKAGINGYEYLDKIVQIPFVIPAASRQDIGNYVDSLIWTNAEKELVNSKFAQKVTETTSAEEENIKIPSGKNSDETMSEPEVEELPIAQTESIPVTFTKPEREAIESCVNDIADNPRKIKRIINIYRLVRLLLPPTFPEHQKIVRWILLTEQWPLHASWIIEEIENDYFLKGKLSKRPHATILDAYDQVKDNIYADDMDSLMTVDAEPILFNQYIHKEPIFTVGEIYDLLHPLTFNLNPAIKSEISKYTAKMAENYIQSQVKHRSRNLKTAIPPPETKSATMKKAIKQKSETEAKV